jgi:hypothetical protein
MMQVRAALGQDTHGPRTMTPGPLSPVLVHLDGTPLRREVERLSDPGFRPTDAALLNLAAKYFFAFVHPGAQENPVPPEELDRLLGLYARCGSLNEPDDDIELMNRLRRLAPALAFPADARRAALLLGELLATVPAATGSRFLGLDVRSGAGLFVLGGAILARRLGFSAVEAWGVEQDEAVAERSGELLRSLGAGNVVADDPALPEAYAMLGGRPVSLVTTTLGSDASARLTEERFFAPWRAVFRALGGPAERAAFFPEGVIAYGREMNASLIFSRINGFQCPAEYTDAAFHPQGVFVNGRLLPLHRLSDPGAAG